MKNLINCHCIGLHSFPVSFENNLYKRIFYAAENHELHKPFMIAIHPHHVDITIRVLKGSLHNITYAIDETGEELMKFKWNSVILNGAGGFEFQGHEKLKEIGNIQYSEGESVFMKACELHTVYIKEGEVCCWEIIEEVPTCEYFPFNYTKHDLSTWKSDGLYLECSDEQKNEFLKNVNLDLVV